MRGRGIFEEFRTAAQASSAVEFAILAPLLALLFFGGFAFCEAVSIARKVTITTRAMADLTSQYQTMAASDMSTVMNASAQVIAPFVSTPLALRISEVTIDGTGQQGWVSWSAATNTSPYLQNCKFQLPPGMLGTANANTSYIYAESAYTYTPLVTGFVPPINLGDRIYMLPRRSTSVTYSGPQTTGTCGS